MNIEVIDVKGNPDINSLDLNIVVDKGSNLDSSLEEDKIYVYINSGSFKLYGNDYYLLDDVAHLVEADPDYHKVVRGSLAVNNETEEVEVVVDDLLSDGYDVPYDFKDGKYKYLNLLFEIYLSAGTTDFSNEELRVLKITPR